MEAGVKITGVETILVAIPIEDHGGAWKFGTNGNVMHCLMVKIVSEDGSVGWGEIFTNNRRDEGRLVATMIAPALLGRDTRDAAKIKAELEREHHNTGPGGPYAFAIAGVDIALWDLIGQERGQPLWRLLGGERPRAVDCYASLTRYGDPRGAAAACTRARTEGYRAIKLHETDPAIVLASREAIGNDLHLMVDASCAWSLGEASETARAMGPARLSWLEEPIWPPDDVHALAQLRGDAEMPIAAGENAGTFRDFTRLIVEGAVDVVQPDLTKGIGVTDVPALAQLADANGVRLVPHCFAPGPGYVAALHVCAAVAPAAMLERFFVDMEAELMGEMMRPHHGRVAVPTGPGLGFAPDPDVVARFRLT